MFLRKRKRYSIPPSLVKLASSAFSVSTGTGFSVPMRLQVPDEIYTLSPSTGQAATAEAVSCDGQRITVLSNPISALTSSVKLPTTVPGRESSQKMPSGKSSLSRIYLSHCLLSAFTPIGALWQNPTDKLLFSLPS